MKKNMYSLMLAEEVIREVDKLAEQNNTNRSNLVNQILAEYVSLTTPEKHIQNIFEIIGNMMGNRGNFLLYSQPNDLTMSIKSSLKYHYRPTIRYEVEMYRTPKETIGQLKIIFRTQSPELLVELTRFFKIWDATRNDLHQTVFYKGRDRIQPGKRKVSAQFRRAQRFGLHRRADRKTRSATISPPLTKCSKDFSAANTARSRRWKSAICNI